MLLLEVMHGITGACCLLLDHFDRCIQGTGASNQRRLLEYSHSILGSNVVFISKSLTRFHTWRLSYALIRFQRNVHVHSRPGLWNVGSASGWIHCITCLEWSWFQLYSRLSTFGTRRQPRQATLPNKQTATMRQRSGER
jgi:hypothetical protein